MDLGFQGGFEFLGVNYPKHSTEFLWANEINEEATKTYNANFDHEIVNGDIWQLISQMPSDCDVLLGGFPCQDISINNIRARGVDGERSGLYRAMVEAIKVAKPKVFVAENVKALFFKNNAKSLETLKRDFGKLGYNLDVSLYNAADYGVPQTRERVLIIGTRDRPMKRIAPTLEKTNWVTASAAIDDLKDKERDEEFAHIWSYANRSPHQGDRRLKMDRPGYTIRAECHGNIQFHYELNRRISMREAARIQSFPDNFKFVSKLRETERQIGNAVPPVFAWYVANHLLKHLDDSS